jgi:hypothetical protein
MRSKHKQQWNPEKYPCFPRAYTPADEYNQKEEKKATSTGAHSVVECGQRGMSTIQVPAAGAARLGWC